MQIGVVRRINLKMLEQNPVEGVAMAVGHSRVRLKLHPKTQAIQVHTGDGGIFRSMVRLAPDYGGHNRDLLRGQAQSLGLGDIP